MKKDNCFLEAWFLFSFGGKTLPRPVRRWFVLSSSLFWWDSKLMQNLWSIKWLNRAQPETTYGKPWENRDSKISGTCLKHIPTHVPVNHTPERKRTRFVYKRARSSDAWKPTSQKTRRPTFWIAWLPTFRNWRPTIGEPVLTIFRENQLSIHYKYRPTFRYSSCWNYCY